MLKSGRTLGYPYSFSRWTDLPGAKWPWFRSQLDNGYFMGIHPTTGVPVRWSLDPKDTLGLIFWTRAPQNLVTDYPILRHYEVRVHFTLTGWHEVEHGVPEVDEGLESLGALVASYGTQNVRWRFSPIPLVPDVLSRFQAIADRVRQIGLNEVYVSFLQPNDRIPETRSADQKLELLAQMAKKSGMHVHLCQEDTLRPSLPGVSSSVCAPPEDFNLSGANFAEGCGCVLMVDPFTMNEACSFGCEFCYAANKETNPHKRNTTKLKVLNVR